MAWNDRVVLDRLTWATMGVLWLAGFLAALGLGHELMPSAFGSALAAVLSGLCYAAAARGNGEFLAKPIAVLVFFLVGMCVLLVFLGYDCAVGYLAGAPEPLSLSACTRSKGMAGFGLTAGVGTVFIGVSVFALCRALLAKLWSKHE